MDNKKLYIGLGVLAVAGIGFYLWKKNQEAPEEKSNFWKGGHGEPRQKDDFSGAIGRRNLGVSRGNLGGGIVNIADPAKLCCCAGTTDSKGWCNNPSTRCCPDIAGEPTPLPTNLGFSGAIGSFGNVGLGANIQNQLNCSPDCGTIDCTRKGKPSTCCKPCATTSTPTGTVSGANGFSYNGTIRMVSPLNY